jgi:hypothetical protein
MSKTDKTDPVWVKLRRESPARVEFHNHNNGVCNFTEWYNSEMTFYPYSQRACGYTVSYYGYHAGFYARPPHGKWYRRDFYGRERAKLRKAKHEMRKLSREDIEDYDIESRQHRHSALWEMY